MRDKIQKIVVQAVAGTKDITEAIDELLLLYNVSGSFDDGYQKGWEDATSEACKEISKNYRPNDR